MDLTQSNFRHAQRPDKKTVVGFAFAAILGALSVSSAHAQQYDSQRQDRQYDTQRQDRQHDGQRQDRQYGSNGQDQQRGDENGHSSTRDSRYNRYHDDRGHSSRYDYGSRNEYSTNRYEQRRRDAYRYSRPVYVPPAVYQRPRQSPGLQFLFPLDLRR